MSATLKTKIANQELSGFVYNASGINNEIYPQLQKIAESGSAAVLLKSTTLEPRGGNENPKYIVKSKFIPGCTFNSMGLPNKGIEKTFEFIKQLKKLDLPFKKPIIISISGLSLLENISLLQKIKQNTEIDLIEINLSCPNIIGKSLVGYDSQQIENLLKEIQKLELKIPFGLKLPAYFDLFNFDILSKLFLKYGVSFIVSINTLGNTLVIDPQKESTIIKPKNGLGGLGGDYLKPVALGNVHNFYLRLKDKISIIGVGGVRNGLDAFEFLLCGADAVQIGTTFAQEGIGAFTKINKELQEILDAKNYLSLNQAKGKLKYI
jgi:dihydroorotate dehydrogenase (fumarate)